MEVIFFKDLAFCRVELCLAYAFDSFYPKYAYKLHAYKKKLVYACSLSVQMIDDTSTIASWNL